MRPPKILIVEDEPSLLYAYSRLLQAAGYEVLGASTGQQGLRLAREGRPDLILLDVILPDLSGVEVCRQIKADPGLAGTLVINVSGLRTSSEDAAEGLEAGADGYLTKPVHERTLLAHTRALLRLKRAETALVDQQERELDSLAEWSRPLPTGVTAQSLGVAPLREGQPDVFKELVGRYSELLNLALEQRVYKVDHRVSEGLRALVERLGFLKAGPRDVVQIHSTALSQKAANAPPRKAQAYVEEGRLLVLEMMGYLAAYYRNYARAASGTAPLPGSRPVKGETP